MGVENRVFNPGDPTELSESEIAAIGQRADSGNEFWVQARRKDGTVGFFLGKIDKETTGNAVDNGFVTVRVHLKDGEVLSERVPARVFLKWQTEAHISED